MIGVQTGCTPRTFRDKKTSLSKKHKKQMLFCMRKVILEHIVDVLSYLSKSGKKTTAKLKKEANQTYDFKSCPIDR
jgi:hypothetical protein